MFALADLSPLPKTLDWRCESVPRGGSVVAVLAGPMVPVRTHTVNRISRPCVRHISGGVLRCMCDDRPDVNTRPLCYAPFIDKAGERIVYILSAVWGWKCRTIKPGTLLRLTRPKAAKRPIAVSLVEGVELDQDWVRKLAKRPPEDIQEYLCHLWQHHELTRHFGFEVRRSIHADARVPILARPYNPRFATDDEPPPSLRLHGEGV